MDDTTLDEFIEGDIKNFSDNISEKITNVKETINNDIVNHYNKLPKLNVESNYIQKKKQFKMADITWQTYRAASIGILFASIFLANYIKYLFELKINDPYLRMIFNIIMLFFILNLGVFLFYKTYFKYISTKKGAKGQAGKRGSQGVPGKNDACDISKKKTANFRREKNVTKKERVINPENTVLDFKTMAKTKKGWYNINTKSTDNAGNGGKISNTVIGIDCGTTKCATSYSPKDKPAEPPKIINNPASTAEEISNNNNPIIGANVNYNKNTNKITALQYLYDRNKNPNPKKHNVGIFGATENNVNKATIGDHRNQTKGIEKYNFTCPANSAIYKVEGAYDKMGIRGVKFHCQDIKTGKLVKAYDNNNKKVYGVNFGIEPRPDDENYHYNKSECSMYNNETKYYPSFISNIGGEYDMKKKNIQNLRFNKCSFYYDK
jgi:hypothetical protein